MRRGTARPIAVEELGGTLRDGTRSISQEIVHQRPLKPQNRYLLFLRPAPGLAGDRFDGRRFSIAGIWAGSFQLVNGRVRLSGGVDPGLAKLDGSAESDVLAQVGKAIAAAAR